SMGASASSSCCWRWAHAGRSRNRPEAGHFSSALYMTATLRDRRAVDAWTALPAAVICWSRDRPGHAVARGVKRRRLFLGILLCATGPCGANADALEETLQSFCAQSGIAAAACKCAGDVMCGDVMCRSMSGSELAIILPFAHSELSPEEIA